MCNHSGHLKRLMYYVADIIAAQSQYFDPDYSSRQNELLFHCHVDTQYNICIQQSLKQSFLNKMNDCHSLTSLVFANTT